MFLYWILLLDLILQHKLENKKIEDVYMQAIIRDNLNKPSHIPPLPLSQCCRHVLFSIDKACFTIDGGEGVAIDVKQFFLGGGGSTDLCLKRFYLSQHYCP